jgi:peptidoglycan/LPS O-acetylase OafA/YrhL
VLILLSGGLILSLYKSKNYTKRILSSRLLVFLGARSYSLYIIHFPLQLVLMFIYRAMHVGTTSFAVQLAWYVLSMAVAWCFGAVLYRFVEHPMRNRFRRTVKMDSN